ncbi:MAG: hypothetical protein WBW33_20195, partial [Bryobacteraceae bacterium]
MTKMRSASGLLKTAKNRSPVKMLFTLLIPLHPLADARGCSENTCLGGLRNPAVDELFRVWGHTYSAHGELALRRRFETLEV